MKICVLMSVKVCYMTIYATVKIDAPGALHHIICRGVMGMREVAEEIGLKGEI